MTITNVTIRKITNEVRLKAIVSVTIENEFVVHDIKVVDGKNGLYVAMPSKKTTAGEYRDIVHPINKECRAQFEAAILDEYQRAIQSLEQVTVEV